MPNDPRSVDGTGDERYPVPHAHGLWCAEDGPAAGHGPKQATGHAQQRQLNTVEELAPSWDRASHQSAWYLRPYTPFTHLSFDLRLSPAFSQGSVPTLLGLPSPDPLIWFLLVSILLQSILLSLSSLEMVETAKTEIWNGALVRSTSVKPWAADCLKVPNTTQYQWKYWRTM